ncbi:phytase [Salinibius halmophilus]|uniref:phytase n=1 Tax=Salinibius halmophilus TaxID=1853216 RepID=UPI001313EF0D|nr:phytase [Salinibius halmophilus]
MKKLTMGLLTAAALPAMAITTEVSFEDFADGTFINNTLITAAEGDGLVLFNRQGQVVEHITSIEAMGADSRTLGQLPVVAVASEDSLHVGTVVDGWLAHWQVTLDFEAAGTCLYQNPTNQTLSAFVYSELGHVRQYKLALKQGKLGNALNGSTPVRSFKLDGELSGCIVDDASQTLLLAEQEVGVWAYGAEAETSRVRQIFAAVPNHLEELEGIALATLNDGRRLLFLGDEGLGLQVFDFANKTFLSSFTPTGFDEVKPVVVADNGLWLANTELDEPVYEFIAWADAQIGEDLTGKVVLSPNYDGIALVSASFETDAVADDDDAADDPAIWINNRNPANSLIIGTNKQAQLEVYNLQGKRLTAIDAGEPNNVDVLTIGEQPIAVTSNRDLNTIAFYDLSPQAPYLTKRHVVASETEEGEVISQVNEVYGLCSATIGGEHYVSVNGKNGQVELWQVVEENKTLNAKLNYVWQLPSQPEGCVFHQNTLLVGEEDEGIWSLNITDKRQTKVISIEDSPLVADVEGLTLYKDMLIASSQGNSSYVLFALATWQPLGRFAITADDSNGIDGASDTDGIAATSASLPGFPEGLFVVQDGNNVDANYRYQNQNFKLIDWRQITQQLGL